MLVGGRHIRPGGLCPGRNEAFMTHLIHHHWHSCGQARSPKPRTREDSVTTEGKRLRGRGGRETRVLFLPICPVLDSAHRGIHGEFRRRKACTSIQQHPYERRGDMSGSGFQDLRERVHGHGIEVRLPSLSDPNVMRTPIRGPGQSYIAYDEADHGYGAGGD